MGRYSTGGPPDPDPAPGDSWPPSSGRAPTVPKAWPRASSPEDSAGSGLPEEDPLILDEIDRIIAELQTRRGEGPAPTEPTPRTAPYSGTGAAFAAAHPGALTGTPSGYLDEHLDGARREIGLIQEEVGRLTDTSTQLRQRVAAAQNELDRIAQEYDFLRDRIGLAGSSVPADASAPLWSEGEVDPSRSSSAGGATMVPGSFPAIRTSSSDGPPPVYEAYTVDRYNRTIDSFTNGRRKVVVWTLVLSAAIGAALVLVVLFSPVVHPPVWVAVLPLVWIIPIPYFLLAFRGTQRVLERNRLNLPEAR